MQQDIEIIKQMIEKTRLATAETGWLLILIGILSAVATLIIGLLELYGFHHLVMPVVIGLALINAGIGYAVGLRESKKNGVKTYAKNIFWNLWMACGLGALLIVFLFPQIGLYQLKSVPALVSLIMGIAVFVTGTVFELRLIQLGSLAWWIGACVMAIIPGLYTFWVMVVVIILGWIVPGLILNKQYNDGRKA